MNGAVEAANKNIKKIMAKMTGIYKDWHKKLPFALHAYWTAYRMEAVLPIEVEIPSLRILMEVKLEKVKWIQARYD